MTLRRARSVAAVVVSGSTIFVCFGCAASASTSPPNASSPNAPDLPEPGSIEEIRQFTTDAKYLPASVSYVPDSSTVPSPKKVLGHQIGAPGVLSRTADVDRYFHALDAASDRVKVFSLGKSEEGREMILAAISDAATLADLDRYRDYTAALADPRTCDRAKMEDVLSKAKAIYYLNGGLHSPETGSPEMLMELAYRLAVSERPEIQRIRDKTIVLVNPVSEPDGRDRVVEWYDRYARGKNLSWDDYSELGDVPYWGHYAFHDNNRDGIQVTLALTKAVNQMYWDYHPTVVHDLHESIPLLYIMTGHGPYSEAIDPVTVAEWTQFAYHESSALQADGLPGVWTWGFWDGWWPGYLFSIANNHNGIGRFYETFGNSAADTFERKLKDAKYLGKKITDAQWYRPWPPDEKVTWSLRNNTNYMEAGVLEALSYASLHGEELLRDFWIKGTRAVERGKSQKPYAWVFPADQRDRGRLAYLVNQLSVHHVEVHRATAAFTVAEGTWPAGTFVVRMDQPYRNAAFNFLTEQKFPADEPNPPYDDVAWTMPLLYGVEGKRIDDVKMLDVSVDRVSGPIAFPGKVSGDGPVFALRDTGQESIAPARFALRDVTVEAAESAFDVGDVTYPAGSWIVRDGRGVRERLEKAAAEFGLDFESIGAAPEVTRHSLDLPRLGVYHTWIATQDCGWVRYTFDHDGIPYTLINDDDVKAGGLRDRFDVILFPETWGDLKAIVHGIDPKHGPMAYTKTAEFPSHGVPDASADITGGMGFLGLANFQKFLDAGGVLVAIANAGTLPVEGGLVRGISTFRSPEVFTPGSEVRAKFRRPEHPIAYGYDETISIFRGNGPIFTVDEKDEAMVVLQFGTKPGDDETDAKDAKPAKDEPLCLSGLVKGEGVLQRKPAILDVPAGKGRVILFAFDPLHRYLNHSDFRLATNAILNWNDLPPTPKRKSATSTSAVGASAGRGE
ncbi:MAG: peptidase [Planctomycetes bacterium]|nr:peptidase [Planctomycetota bacterium]MBI3844197.1 peptidase [Planctomycetota bacterium]